MLAIIWLTAIVVGTAIGAGKGHGVAGFTLSLFLAWFGVLIALFLPNDRRQPPPNITNIRNEINGG